MKEELEQLYDDLPADEPRSRVEAYRDSILRWRRQGRTYRRIREWLAVRGVQIGISALHEFVQRRSRPRKEQLETLTQAAAIPSSLQSRSRASDPVRAMPGRTPEEAKAARAALRAAFDKPLFPDERKPLFERRPGRTRNLNNERLGARVNGSSIDTDSGDAEKTGTD